MSISVSVGGLVSWHRKYADCHARYTRDKIYCDDKKKRL